MSLYRDIRVSLVLPLVLALSVASVAHADGVDKFMKVNPVVNEGAGFLLRISVNHEDRVYREGDRLEVEVESEKDANLYVLYFDTSGVITCLFPNFYATENRILGRKPVAIPGPEPKFRVEATAPFGKEVLYVVAVEPDKDLFRGLVLDGLAADRPVASLTEDQVRKALGRLNPPKGMVVRPVVAGAAPASPVEPGPEPGPPAEDPIDPAHWAERHLTITTVEKGGETPPDRPRRLGVFVGISDYEKVRKLRVSHLDAERMHRALQELGRLDEAILLTNEQATREGIRQAIAELVRKSRPGDTVFIYFSGHGGRCADTNGDEADGLDEYLVPQDGVVGQPDTMILDDTFARWMADLDGRQVCIILDNCYSGGAGKAAKADGAQAKARLQAPSLDFFDGELRRAKDLGQTGTAVIAASQPDQIAWEMPAGDDGSVLTYYLIRTLEGKQADADGDGRLSVAEVFRAVHDQVTTYVAETLQADQEPLLIDNTDDGIIIRP